MTQDKFIKRNQLIARHLEQIACERAAAGNENRLTPSTPYFRELLIAQERLLLAAERMLEPDSGFVQRAAA